MFTLIPVVYFKYLYIYTDMLLCVRPAATRVPTYTDLKGEYCCK